MDPHFGGLFSNDIVKEEVMDSEEGQMRLTAGRDDKWAAKAETCDTRVVKKEVEDEEMGRYGGSSTKKKPDFGENPEPKRRKLIPPIEANSYVTQQGLIAEVKEETAPFPVVIGQAVSPTSAQAGGSLPFAKLGSDNQVFNAHDFFTNQSMVKGEINEDEEERNDDERDHTADGGESEKEDEKEKMCPVDGCLEKYSSEEALRTHMRIHPKPLLCGVCKKTWPSAVALIRHYVVHSGEKPFHCEYCEKKFTEAGTLKKHIRQHTGELPYGCEMCDKKFKSSSALTYHRGTHMVRHPGQKPFECSECSQCFSLKSVLERHKAFVHGGIKKHSCPECDHKSAQKSDLNRHIRRKHQK